MKVCILAGGKGSRLNENDSKPMTTVGGIPIIQHVMDIYARHGHDDFIILGGMHIEKIDNYLKKANLPQKTTLLDTGKDSNTAARVFKARKLVGNDKMFLLAYCDCLTSADINDEIAEHMQSGKILTNMGFIPDGRFGFMDLAEDGTIEHLYEKQNVGQRFANGGYFVCNREIFDIMTDDETVAFELGPVTDLARQRQVHCYRHRGWFSVMDTPQDRAYLERLWTDGNIPWKA